MGADADTDPWPGVMAEIVTQARRRAWLVAACPGYEVDDLVQDAAVRAWRWSRAAGGTPSAALLATFVDRSLVDALRRFGPRSRAKVRRDRVQGPVPATDDGAVAVVMAEIDRLPDRMRAVVEALAAGYQQAEIAAVLGVNASRVSQIAAVARRRLVGGDKAAPVHVREGGVR